MFLPPEKLTDKQAAVDSVRRVLDARAGIETILVGDGWCAFRNGRELVEQLLADSDAGPKSDPDARAASDSGQFKIPQSRTSIPVPRAGRACSFCDKPADAHRLVSGTAVTKKDPAAVCASCAARLEAARKGASARCDFCQQEAADTVHERQTTICRECIDLALAIFGDADA
jgi:hypothetical protein